ncbi:MAG: hypothetical protein ACYC5M_16930 [Anaerolineae bacterium]
MHLSLGTFDILLVLVLSVQATVLAYLHDLRWKGFVLLLPIPFTVAALAVGTPVGIGNVVGLILLYGFTHGVRLLHQTLHMPILPAVALPAVAYVVAGSWLAPLLPAGETAFWVACALVMAMGVSLYLLQPARTEPGQRTPLPVWIKLPIIMAIILGLVAVKGMLQGFTTAFPMVGVVAAYEARRSLWTMSRQIPLVMLIITPMIAICRLGQTGIGLGWSLAIAWVYVLVFLSLVAWLRRAPSAPMLPATGDPVALQPVKLEVFRLVSRRDRRRRGDR